MTDEQREKYMRLVKYRAENKLLYERNVISAEMFFSADEAILGAINELWEAAATPKEVR